MCYPLVYYRVVDHRDGHGGGEGLSSLKVGIASDGYGHHLKIRFGGDAIACTDGDRREGDIGKACCTEQSFHLVDSFAQQIGAGNFRYEVSF